MPAFKRVDDKWAYLRQNLCGNIEPQVELQAITMPLYPPFDLDGNPVGWNKTDIQYASTCYDSETFGMDWKAIEQMPALAAATSYGSKEKIESDHERAIKLNKKLIEMGHHTCLESIQFNFHIAGISKACGSQISRHRAGQGHVSASRRFRTAGAAFVYPVLDYVEDEQKVKEILRFISNFCEECYDDYQTLRNKYELKKEDSRVVLPVSYATERSWFINARALRDFFRLRLAADSEWEIRRMAFMLLDIVSPLLPSLFLDISEKIEN